MAQVLKPKHSLIGKSLIPVIAKVRAADIDNDITLARLKKEYPLEDYTLAELRTEFERLTGESVKDVILLTGKEDNLDGVRLLLHHAILHSNVVGAPKGQTLALPVVDNPSGEKPAAEPVDTASQLKTMRQDLDALKSQKDGVQVEEALATVRTLAARPKLTSPNILMAALENLVEVANKTGYKDATLFSKSLSTCKKYEENDDFCGLVLKLFGSTEDKKISSTIADWVKAKKYNEKGKDSAKENVAPLPHQPYPLPSTLGFPQPCQPFQYPMGYGGYAPMSMLYSAPHFQHPAGGFAPRTPFRGRGRRGKANMTCYFCKESGHFVSNCPKLKKD